MKVTVNRQELSDALNRAFAVAPSKSDKDVLRYVHAIAQEGVLILTATNDEIILRLEIPAEVKRSGVCLLSPRLRAICREASSETITFELQNQTVLVTASQGDWKLETHDPDGFPEFRTLQSKAMLIPADTFTKAINRTIIATDAESTRYALAGVLIAFEGGEMAFAATDGRRLSLHKTSLTSDGEEFRAVVPTQALKAVLASLDKVAEVGISKARNQLEFVCGKTLLQTRLVEGRFPNYQDVIPTDCTFEAQSIVGPLLSAIRQSMIVATKETRGVDFVFNGEGNLTLHTKAADVGTSKVEIPIQCDTPMSVALDPSFLTQFFQVVPAELPVQIKGTNKDSAILVEADGTIYVAMPISRD